MADATPILITGATGLVGTALIRALRDRRPGQPIRIMTRRPHAGMAVGGVPVEGFGWNAEQGPVDPGALRDVGHVIHLAGEPVAQRWSAAARERILESRIGTLDRLRAACLEAGVAPRLLSASAMGAYAQGPEALSESGGQGRGFLADVVRDWEDAALRFGALGGREVRLRIGLVLSPEGGVLNKLMPLYTWGLGAPLSPGTQWQSWIALDDLVSLFLHALDHPDWEGAFNATAPHPVMQRDFSRTLARTMGRPHFLPPVPAWALRLRFGEAAEALLASHRVLPTRALEHGFVFRHGHLDDALGALLQR